MAEVKSRERASGARRVPEVPPVATVAQLPQAPQSPKGQRGVRANPLLTRSASGRDRSFLAEFAEVACAVEDSDDDAADGAAGFTSGAGSSMASADSSPARSDSERSGHSRRVPGTPRQQRGRSGRRGAPPSVTIANVVFPGLVAAPREHGGAQPKPTTTSTTFLTACPEGSNARAGQVAEEDEGYAVALAAAATVFIAPSPQVPVLTSSAAIQEAIETVFLAEPPATQTKYTEELRELLADAKFENLVTSAAWWGVTALKERQLGPSPAIEDAQRDVFHSAAMSYGRLFSSIPDPRSGTAIDHKDRLTGLAPLLVAKSSHLLLSLAFPTEADAERLTSGFRGLLLRTWTLWISGLAPQTVVVSGWPRRRFKKRVDPKHRDFHASRMAEMMEAAALPFLAPVQAQSAQAVSVAVPHPPQRGGNQQQQHRRVVATATATVPTTTAVPTPPIPGTARGAPLLPGRSPSGVGTGALELQSPRDGGGDVSGGNHRDSLGRSPLTHACAPLQAPSSASGLPLLLPSSLPAATATVGVGLGVATVVAPVAVRLLGTGATSIDGFSPRGPNHASPPSGAAGRAGAGGSRGGARVTVTPSLLGVGATARWYEHGRMTGHLCLERLGLSEARPPRGRTQPLACQSPLVAHYLAQRGIDAAAPAATRASPRSMRWTALTPIDRAGTRLVFSRHSAPLAAEAGRAVADGDAALAASVDEERRALVLAQRAQRVWAGRAGAAATAIARFYSPRHPDTAALRTSLVAAMRKALAEYGATIFERIATYNAALADVRRRLFDVPNPGRRDVVRLSRRCYRRMKALERLVPSVVAVSNAEARFGETARFDAAATASLEALFAQLRALPSASAPGSDDGVDGGFRPLGGPSSRPQPQPAAGADPAESAEAGAARRLQQRRSLAAQRAGRLGLTDPPPLTAEERAAGDVDAFLAKTIGPAAWAHALRGSPGGSDDSDGDSDGIDEFFQQLRSSDESDSGGDVLPGGGGCHAGNTVSGGSQRDALRLIEASASFRVASNDGSYSDIRSMSTLARMFAAAAVVPPLGAGSGVFGAAPVPLQPSSRAGSVRGGSLFDVPPTAAGPLREGLGSAHTPRPSTQGQASAGGTRGHAQHRPPHSQRQPASPWLPQPSGTGAQRAESGMLGAAWRATVRSPGASVDARLHSSRGSFTTEDSSSVTGGHGDRHPTGLACRHAVAFDTAVPRPVSRSTPRGAKPLSFLLFDKKQ